MDGKRVFLEGKCDRVGDGKKKTTGRRHGRARGGENCFMHKSETEIVFQVDYMFFYPPAALCNHTGWVVPPQVTADTYVPL